MGYNRRKWKKINDINKLCKYHLKHGKGGCGSVHYNRHPNANVADGPLPTHTRKPNSIPNSEKVKTFTHVITHSQSCHVTTPDALAILRGIPAATRYGQKEGIKSYFLSGALR
ncbi:uncharacterized protein TM35_000051110 [Trypanosoma theileri]|uniref:Uncharacterized protein n=1 Tax=Trypanosoma theileri TaxID=67003 RepID=A0A1X0P3Q6_9TRYP|nr:uncharacterized protein TM35_000051110 [Trypanosoma theileri]ORC91515.1 hypothetical protein TM35_000051110 [Trypanosoma theileri]